MSDNINFDYKNLSPFKWFVLENFPFIEADFDALTEWQLFCKIGKEINKIIDSQNIVGEQAEILTNAFNNLKNYVDNYFDNLDVQDEINNKLNQMVEDGTLQEIIADYLNSKAIFGFDNVESMKSANNLINGSYAQTYGYYSKNDGGNALYKIRNITNEDVVDNMFILPMENENLVAELLVDDLYIEQIGAKGDGVNDDTSILQDAIDYCINKKITLKSRGGKTFLITSSLNFNNKIDMDFNNSTIKTNSAIDMLVFNYLSGNEYQGYLKNIVIDMNSVALTGILGTRIIKKLISGITIKNISNIGYQIDLGNEVIFENSHLYGTSNTSIGLMLNKGDCHYKDLIMIDVHTAIYTKSSNFFSRIHAWIKTPSLINNSIFFKSDTTNESFLNQCYSDTYHKAFQIERYHRLKLTEHYNHLNASILTNEILQEIQNIYIFYYTDKSYSQFTTVTNSILEGLNGNSSNSLLSNLSQNERLMFIDSNTRIQDLSSNLKTNIYDDITVTSASVSLSTNKNNRIEHINNIANLSLYVTINQQIQANTNTQIVSFNTQYAPLTEKIFIAPFGFEQGYKASGYVFCTLNPNGSLYINSDVNLPVNARIYINETYIINIKP